MQKTEELWAFEGQVRPEPAVIVNAVRAPQSRVRATSLLRRRAGKRPVLRTCCKWYGSTAGFILVMSPD